jgi:hypothetical protein
MERFSRKMGIGVQYRYAQTVLWSRNEKDFQLTLYFSFWATCIARRGSIVGDADHADAYDARYIHGDSIRREWAGSGSASIVVDAAIYAFAGSSN